MDVNGLTGTNEWKTLQEHYNKICNVHLRDLFSSDKERAEKFTIEENDIYFDYSKNLINDDTVKYLLKLARARDLAVEIDMLFNGETLNRTEDRHVLHIALRNMDKIPICVEGKDIKQDILSVLEKMRKVSHEIRNGEWRGYSGKKIKYVINIGIGGSDLGPFMVSEALKYYSKRELKLFYVSNVDRSHIEETLREINPEETLFVIASKTFTTLETLTNAETAKQWILSHLKSPQSMANHFVAATANVKAAIDFGIDKNNILTLWDWVVGRFSLTSAIGFSIMLSIGYENFINMLKGFFSMDNHFRNTPFEKNIPVIMGLLGIWYNNFFNAETHAIIPYNQYLYRFPAYVQECDMESNGKSVDRKGKKVRYQTSPVIWGDTGTNGQHSFFQLIHQGTKLIPCDFIGFVEPLNQSQVHHEKLMANLFAQTRALAFGRTKEEVEAAGVKDELILYKTFEGNRPSNTILLKKLTPFTLGRLISMYENKTITQGILWDIFSFDQWGVELGKTLAKQIVFELADDYNKPIIHDSSTNALIKFYKKYSKV